MRSVKLVSGLLVLLFTASAFVQSYDLPKSIARGKALYVTNCMNCHMEDGKGMEGVYPPLEKADFLKRPAKDIIETVLKGQSGEVKVNGVLYNGVMPAQDYLTDTEIADILNYVNNSWGNKNPKAITPAQVKTLRP